MRRVMYFLSAFLNIILGAKSELSKPSYSYNPLAGKCPAAHRLFSAILKLPLTILLIPLYLLWSILPSKLQSKLHYSWQYVVKATKRIPKAPAIKLRPLRKKANGNSNSNNSNNKNADSLARLLNIDILTLIAYKLHYVDVINLSLVCRSIRNTIFPDAEVDRNAEYFRIYTCDMWTKSQCWGCNIQICQVR
jgi:hypothetical protein